MLKTEKSATLSLSCYSGLSLSSALCGFSAVGPWTCKQYSHSSFPFSLPRSFLSFLGFLGVLSSTDVTADRRLEPPERPGAPGGPGVRARGGTGGWQFELGVGGISPSARAWYCNSDFSKNLKIEMKRLISFIYKVRQRSSIEPAVKNLQRFMSLFQPPYLRSSFAFRNFSSK